MAGVDIQVALQGGTVENGWVRFEPGATVHGTARLTADGEVDCRRALAWLEWHTEGRGTRSSGRTAEVEIIQGPLTAMIPSTVSFSLQVPTMPWSYAGYYINIIWEVIVKLDIPRAQDAVQRQPVIVAPR